MTPVDWVRRHKIVAVLIGLAVGVLLWFVLLGYIDPDAKGATHRKDVVQVFALIIAGIVGVIGAAVGLSNLRIGRENLEHNRKALEQNLRVAQQNLEHNQKSLREQLNNQGELEEQRAQDGALQAYYEHMGDLLTDHNLSTTDRVDIKLLARAQTLTVAGRLDQDRKRQLLVFLYGAGLINKGKTVVVISGADFSAANLFYANLSGANLRDAILRGADLSNANLTRAKLVEADLSAANLIDAKVIEQQLATCKSLKDATCPTVRSTKASLKRRTIKGRRYNV